MPDLVKFLPEKSFVHSWLHAWSEDEAPNSYLVLAALAALGSGLSRNLYIEFDIDRCVFPMLSVILLGPPGIGKSTSIQKAMDHLLAPLPIKERPLFVFSATKEKLLSDLATHPHAFLFAEELSNFISRDKYKESLATALTSLLENKGWHENGTISRGPVDIKAEECALSFFGGSTVDWFHENLPEFALEGGFLCRFILCREDTKGKNVPFPRAGSDPAFRAEIERRLDIAKDSFYRCLVTQSCRMEFGPYVREDVLAPWATGRDRRTGRMAHFDSRAKEMVMKLSLLLAASCRAKYIEEEHARGAIGIYESCMDSIESVVQKRTDKGRELNMVLEHIKTGGGMLDMPGLCRAMSHITTAVEVEKDVQSLLASKMVAFEDGRLRARETRRRRA